MDSENIKTLKKMELKADAFDAIVKILTTENVSYKDVVNSITDIALEETHKELKIIRG